MVLKTIGEITSKGVTSDGYVLNYPDYVSGWITPEYGFWYDMNNDEGLNESDFPDAMWYTSTGMSAWEFFNRVEVANIMLNYENR